MNKIRVVICDDQEHILEYLCSAINSQEDMEVVGSAKSGEEILEVIKSVDTDVALVDIQMESERAGIEAIEKISTDFPNVKSVVITVHESDDLILDAYMARAIDYIIKMSDTDVICDCVRRVYNNETYIGAIFVQKPGKS